MSIAVYQNLAYTCYCLATVVCETPGAFYSTTPVRQYGKFYINPNATLAKRMFTACYPYDGLLASTLECFYDSSCFELFVSNVSNFTPLEATLESQYLRNTNISDIINKAIVE